MNYNIIGANNYTTLKILAVRLRRNTKLIMVGRLFQILYDSIKEM